jgi:hypothetical protein
VRRPWALALLLALAALPGCGGGGGGSTSAPASTSTAQKSASATERARPPKQQSHLPSQAVPNPTRQSAPEGAPTPGTKAVAPGVPVTRGGDNSIQAFGTEGAEAERSQAFSELRAYLGALGGREWARACALASGQLRQDLGRLVAQSPTPPGDAKKPKGCAATLEALLGAAAPQALREATQVGELLSFRVQGEYAYLIFRGAGGKAMFIAMADEEGKWKVNVPKPEEFTQASPGGSQ